MCIKVKDVGSFLFWLTSPMDVSYTMHSKGFKKKLVIWKGNETTVTKTWASPECSLEGMMLKLKLQYFGHLMRRVDSLEKVDAGRDWGQEEKGTTGWDGWMASPTRWTWVWVNSGSWWWTGRPGVLLFMGSQRVGHDWATELNWTEPHKTPT